MAKAVFELDYLCVMVLGTIVAVLGWLKGS